jgi:hypothetical protein
MTPETYWNCRFSIADCRWTLEGVAPSLFQSSIGNQQSTMKTWSLGCGYAALSDSGPAIGSYFDSTSILHGRVALNRGQA